MTILVMATTVVIIVTSRIHLTIGLLTSRDLREREREIRILEARLPGDGKVCGVETEKSVLVNVFLLLRASQRAGRRGESSEARSILGIND